MPTINQSILLPYCQEDLFHLINDVKTYPEFMPYCTGAKVLEQDETSLTAAILLQKGPLKESFTTKNDLIPYEKMVLHLVDGPFKYLEGTWTFTQKTTQMTLVTLHLEYDFDSFIVAKVFGALFQKAAQSLIQSFSNYAHKVLTDD